jgi:hypothetical protein
LAILNINSFYGVHKVSLTYHLIEVNRIIAILLCLALALPTLESVVTELGFLDQVEFCTIDFCESESENNESEKEEKNQKEKELVTLVEWSVIVRTSNQYVQTFESVRFESMTFEIPSPPPDHLS